jgi:hypothetical protein
MASITVYPDPHPESTSMDAHTMRVNTSGETFTTLRNGAGTSSSDGDTAYYLGYLWSNTTTDKWNQMCRGFFLFDTNILLDVADIISAKFRAYLVGKGDTLNGSPAVHIAASNPASNTAIANGDHVNISRTSFGSRAYADIAAGYNDWDLNAAGIANIVDDGISKFSAQFSWDINNSAPAWASNKQSYVMVYPAETAGTTKDAQLVIIYSPRALTDAESIVDSNIKNIGKRFGDSSAIAEGSKKDINRASGDSVVISEAMVRDLTIFMLTKNLSESVGINEAREREWAINRQLSDSVAATEAGARGISKVSFDMVGIIDNNVRTIFGQLFKSLSDSIGIAESRIKTWDIKRSLSGIISVAEHNIISNLFYFSLTTIIGITESASNILYPPPQRRISKTTRRKGSSLLTKNTKQLKSKKI